MSRADQTIQDLKAIFNARSVAVVGASETPGKFGYLTMESLLGGGYEGRLFPVNPKSQEIMGLKAYPSISDLPVDIEAVVVIVPAKFVAGVLREAAAKGAKGAIILSAGFREAGRPDLEEEIVAIARETGLRLMGPNIQGINYLPNKLCAMFFPVITTSGPLGVISQSGTVTAALSEWAADEGLGISAAINLGNQVDLSESDYLDFLAEDEKTKAIAMYIEGVKKGRRFLETIRRVGERKPIAVLKGGRSSIGAKSAASHTGSLAGSHQVFSAACRQFGVFAANDLETLYDGSKALATLPSPRGSRLFIVSTSGGAGTLSADEAEGWGLTLPELDPEFVEELKGLELSPLATLANPLDLASISAADFTKVLIAAGRFDLADVVLVSYGDPVVGGVETALELAARLKAGLAVSYLGGGDEEKEGRVKLQAAGVPVFPAPERAVRGIGAAVWRAEYRRARGRDQEDTGHPRPTAPHRSSTAGSYVAEPEAVELLAKYHIPYPEHGLARERTEAVRIADGLGYPVVLKIVSPDAPHKSDVGGVRLDLGGPGEVESAFDDLIATVKGRLPEASIQGVLVCRQAAEGLEVIVGATDDPVFGATVMFGLGGIFTEVLKDVAFRIAPLQRIDAREMIREIKGYSVLSGVRGQAAVDVAGLERLILAVSRMVTEEAGIKELDLNPVRVYEEGLVALDARLVRDKGPAEAE